MTDNPSERFPGFESHYHKNYFTYPLVLESFWHQLSGSEQKVLDFVLRQTIGFRKTRDTISLDQFTDGIGKRNNGTGLSRSQVRRAIDGLEDKGFVEVSRSPGCASTFKLVLDEKEVMFAEGYPGFKDIDLRGL